MTEILLAEKFELDEGFQPYHPPFRNLRTEILDLRGLDSGRIPVLRGGVGMSTGGFSRKSSSRRILVGTIPAGGLRLTAR